MRWPIPLLTLLSLTLLGASAPAPVVELEAAKRLLPISDACSNVDCLLEHAYQADPKASQLALELWHDSGDVAGVGPEEVMDGGFRGTIHLVPQLPINVYRKHLGWVVDGAHAIDDFFAALYANQPPPSYRWRALELRFVRSIDKHRPSAYAQVGRSNTI